MDGFIKSFNPILKRLKKYIVEIVIVTIALLITIVALAIYIKSNQGSDEEIVDTASTSPDRRLEKSTKIYVDVSGAVKKPNLYQVDFGARIKELIDRAGGLSADADIMFFTRNFNLARIVSDQEKIYVPSTLEIDTGIFIQNQQTLNYISPVEVINAPTTDSPTTSSQLISLNYATVEELDQLPGVGQVTANKIISGRPYGTLEELLTKKVVNKGVYEKLKSLISL